MTSGPERKMKHPQLYWGASVGALLGYVFAALTGWPIRLFYYSTSDSWGLVDHPGEPVVRWYGRLINAGLGALLGMALALPWKKRPWWPAVWTSAVLALLVLVFHERHWFMH